MPLRPRLLRFWEAWTETQFDLRSSSELADLGGSYVGPCNRHGVAAGRLVQVTALSVPSPSSFWFSCKNIFDKPAAIAGFGARLQGEATDLRPETLPQVA